MNPGKLDRPFTIQYDTGTTKNSRGEHVESWTTYATAYGMFEVDTGVERGESNQLVAVSTVMITCRYNSGITAKMRVLSNSVYYAIVGVQPLPGRQYMRLKCITKDNENV